MTFPYVLLHGWNSWPLILGHEAPPCQKLRLMLSCNLVKPNRTHVQCSSLIFHELGWLDANYETSTVCFAIADAFFWLETMAVFFLYFVKTIQTRWKAQLVITVCVVFTLNLPYVCTFFSQLCSMCTSTMQHQDCCWETNEESASPQAHDAESGWHAAISRRWLKKGNTKITAIYCV